MSVKVVFLLLTLSWAYVAQTVRIVTDPNVSLSEYELTFSMDDTVKSLNGLVSKVLRAVDRLNDLLPGIKNTFKDQILAEIQKRIDVIIQAVGIDTNSVASCIKSEKGTIEELASTVGSKITECVKLFDPVKKQIIADSTQVINEIFDGIDKCFKDHSWSPKLLECVKELVDPSTAKVNAILEQINKATEDDEALIAATTPKTTTNGKDINNKK